MLDTTTMAIYTCQRMALQLEVQRKAERKLVALCEHYARHADLNQLHRAAARLQQLRRSLYH
jgi:hypothetical protein